MYNVFVFLAILCCFCLNKPKFVQEDGISITMNKFGVLHGSRETFITTSVFVYKSSKSFIYLHRHHRRKSLFNMLLLLSGDIEVCPGPTNIESFYKRKGIKFVHQNICGLLNKIPLLETFFFKLKRQN